MLGANVKALAEKLRDVGVIEIKVPSETGGRAQGFVRNEKDLAVPGEGIVPESAMKGEAKSHGTV